MLHAFVPDRLWEAVALPKGEAFVQLLQPGVVLTGLALAFVASAESLLSASAVDRMQDRVRTNYDRELFAQLTGVLAGLALSLVESVRHLRRPGFRLREIDTGAATELRLAGTATFLRLPQLLSAVEGVPTGRDVRIRTRGLWHIDHAFASALQQLAAGGGRNERRVLVS